MLGKPFEWMVQHYYENIVNRCLPHLKEGKICDTSGKPLKEGPDSENPYYKGMIFVYDGSTILEKASELIVRKKKGIENPVKLDTLEEFVKYLGERADVADQKYLYNSNEGLLYPMKGEYINNYPQLIPDPEKMIDESFPYDFLSKDGSIPLSSIGTKSFASALIAKLEIKLNDEKNATGRVETILINQTPVGAGMGYLSHFDRKGVVEDFHVDYDANLKSLVGTYRQRDENGKMVVVRDPLVEALNMVLYDIVAPQPDTAKEQNPSYRTQNSLGAECA
jgi:hypothetical protein